MLVKMFGRMWRIIGTDPATGEPIYEPAEAVAATPAPTPAPPPPPPPVVEQEETPVSSDPAFTPHVRTVSTSLGKEKRDKPFYANRAKPPRTAIPDVVGNQVKKGKSLTPVADRDAGPKRRPDGSVLPTEVDTPLSGCLCETPCFCTNPLGYFTPWEVAQRGKISPEATLEEALDDDLYKEGGKFGSKNEEAVIVRRFGDYQKMTGYDDATGEPIYVPATKEEIAAAVGNIIEMERPAPRTQSVGEAAGFDTSGKRCQTERIPLDFKRYGITARPGRGIPLSPEAAKNFTRDQEAMDKELSDNGGDNGRDLLGDE